MINRYSLVFDVGGVIVKAAVINGKGELLNNSLAYYAAKGDHDRETILDHFVDIIYQQSSLIMDKAFTIEKLGFAFPGPFDYKNGICFISGVNKFDSLYGVNIVEELRTRLINRKVMATRLSASLKIVFENNAEMFALGEWLKGEIRHYRKVLCLTIGHGTGSAFLENGEVLKDRSNIPAGGWVYNVPFMESQIDDYISSRGIMSLARQWSSLNGFDVEELAEIARKGHSEACKVFQSFGETIVDMLDLFVPRFLPDVVIIGGQVVHCYDLFKVPLETYATLNSIKIMTTITTSNSTFMGISNRMQLEEVKEV